MTTKLTPIETEKNKKLCRECGAPKDFTIRYKEQRGWVSLKKEYYLCKICFLELITPNVRRDGNKNYYTLSGKTFAEEISKPVEEIKSKNIPTESSSKTMVNEQDHRTYADPEIIPIQLPTSIQLISDLLPALINATLITIEPEDNILKDNFPQQKSLLDLYETLPNHLKSLVKLHIDQESTVQKITIPLEG